MRVGVATDHGGFGLKEELVRHLSEAGHEVIDVGAYSLSPGDDYPDFVIPLAQAVASGQVERGVAVCGSGVGASLCAGGRVVGPAVARDLVDTFLAAEFSQAERHLRRLAKVASLEAQTATQYDIAR
jgi:ribose 5-phosphate isomerase B